MPHRAGLTPCFPLAPDVLDLAFPSNEREFDPYRRTAGCKTLHELQRTACPRDDGDLPSRRRIRHQQTDRLAQPLVESRDLARVPRVDDTTLAFGGQNDAVDF